MFRDGTFETYGLLKSPKNGVCAGICYWHDVCNVIGEPLIADLWAEKTQQAEWPAYSAYSSTIYWSLTMQSFSPSFFLPFLLGLALVASPAQAHKDHLKPMYGGVTADAEIFQVELVLKGTKATLYVTEHGAPVETADAKGTLTLLSGKDKEEVVLTPNGYQSMGAKLKAKPARDAKAVAVIEVPSKGTGTVRFTLK